MKRASTHIIETKSTDIFRAKVNGFYQNGDALFRDITERDYGIDGLVELFEDGCPSGEIALVQIKGKEDTIIPLKKCKYQTSI